MSHAQLRLASKAFRFLSLAPGFLAGFALGVRLGARLQPVDRGGSSPKGRSGRHVPTGEPSRSTLRAVNLPK